MFQRRTLDKLAELSVLFAVFFTPLLFFVPSRDQFELPKLVFLALLAVPILFQELFRRDRMEFTPLSYALAALFAVQAIASLPSNSLSWRTSLLGDYENFSGLFTLAILILWFLGLVRVLTPALIAKAFLFNTLAAFLSSLYAVGQHYGFDFVRWNPESVNSTREFAALGNPNFLSAYLALSIPLFLGGWTLEKRTSEEQEASGTGPLAPLLGLFGLFLLVLGTPKGLGLLSLLPSPPLHAASVALGLLLLSFSFLRFIRSRSALVIPVGLTLMAFGLFSTGSRGGLLGALAGVVLWAGLAIRRGDHREFLGDPARRSFRIPAAFLAAALLALLFFGRPFLQRIVDSTAHAGNSLAVSRLHIWRPAVRIVEDRPLLGVGLDTFKIAFPYYSGIEFNQIDGMFVSSRTAHNEFLQVAATTGLAGLAAYLLVLILFIALGWKTYRSASANTKRLLAALFAAAAAYHVQNLFSFGVVTINFMWFFCLAAVQALALATDSPKSPTPERGWKPAGLLKASLAGILLLVLLFFPIRRLAADIAFGEGTALSSVLQKPAADMDRSALLYYSDEQIRLTAQAAGLVPEEVKYRLYLGLAYEQRARLDPDHALDFDQEALHCYAQAVRMSPANAYYYSDEGRVYAALARKDPRYWPKAEEAYGQCVRWSPTNPAFLLNWAVLLDKTGKESEAETQVQKAFDLDRSFSAKVMAQLAMEEYKGGDKKIANRILDEAVQGNSLCAEVYYCQGILDLSEGDRKKARADLERTKELNPTPEKNPSIQYLDQFLQQAGR